MALLDQAMPLRCGFRARSCRGAGDVVGGESFGDGEEPVAGEELVEDPTDDEGGLGIWGESAKVLAVGRLGGVGVRGEFPQCVACPVRKLVAAGQAAYLYSLMTPPSVLVRRSR